MPIQIDFVTLEDYVLMTFDSAHSGSALCPTIGQEIPGALGKELGIEVKAAF